MKKGQILGSALIIFFCAFLLALLGIVFFVLLHPSPEKANQQIRSQAADLETERVLLGLLRQPIGSGTVADQIVLSAKTGNYADIDQRVHESLDATYASAVCRPNARASGCAWKVVVLKGEKEVHSIALEDTEYLVWQADAKLPGDIELKLDVYSKVQPLELGQ